MAEREVSMAIVESFEEHLKECLVSDVIIVGGGPSGMMAARELAMQKRRVVVLEKNNYLGGGFWMGGYLMNKVTFRDFSREVLDGLGIPYEERGGVLVADAPAACSKLIYEAVASGARVLNMTFFEDPVIKDGRVCGAVINWSPITHLPREVAALDPIALESRVLIDATGHEAVVVRKLEKRGLVRSRGEGPMWIEKSERDVVEHTGEVFPGVIITGMAVAAYHGLPRMGPTFGAMLLSGRKAAELALKNLK